MAQCLRQLSTLLTKEFGVAVLLITNQAVANPDGMSFAKDATKVSCSTTCVNKLRVGAWLECFDSKMDQRFNSPSIPV